MGEDGPAYLARRPEDQDFGFRCHRFHLTNSWLAVEWVVGIAVGIAAVERLPIVGMPSSEFGEGHSGDLCPEGGYRARPRVSALGTLSMVRTEHRLEVLCYINAVASSLQVHGDSSQDGSGRSLDNPEGQCSIGFQPVFCSPAGQSFWGMALWASATREAPVRTEPRLSVTLYAPGASIM